MTPIERRVFLAATSYVYAKRDYERINERTRTDKSAATHEDWSRARILSVCRHADLVTAVEAFETVEASGT